jgi:hypothetical protein
MRASILWPTHQWAAARVRTNVLDIGAGRNDSGTTRLARCPVRDSNPPHRIKSPGLYQMS